MKRFVLVLSLMAIMAAMVVATAVPAFALTPNPSQTMDRCTFGEPGINDICHGGGGSGGDGYGGGGGQNFQVDYGTGEYTWQGGNGAGGSEFGGVGAGGGNCWGDFDTGERECTRPAHTL
jgi:hypothetical protein